MNFSQKVEYYCDLAKYVKTYKADATRVASLGFGVPVTDTSLGNVVLSNDLLAVQAGMLPSVPAAVAHVNGFIYVNDAYMKLDVEVRRAIAYHEAGHLACGHLKKPLWRRLWLNVGRHFGVASSLQQELEADLYAHEKGYDMIGALLTLRRTLTERGLLSTVSKNELDTRILELMDK